MNTEKEEYGKTVLPEAKICLRAITLRMVWYILENIQTDQL